jgi:glycerol-3-phosphate dehydrogenase
MYVHEEKVSLLCPAFRLLFGTQADTRMIDLIKVDGRKLTELINEKHENVKYLPDIKLPENVVANPSATETAKGADLLIFVLPHQVSTPCAVPYE